MSKKTDGINTSPQISVIVPCYNHAPFLRQRIESILGQTYAGFELILLDDGSTDGSRAILDEYSSEERVSHTLLNTDNSGLPFAQWQRGIALARGEWVWIAESDDWAEPQFLEQLLQAASKHPRATLVISGSEWDDEQGTPLWPASAASTIRSWEGEQFVRERLSACNSVVNVSACLMRRAALQNADRQLYAGMHLCGDWMLYLLLCEQGSVVELTTPLNHYRQHPQNTSLGAEHEGLTFLEGAAVLDRLCKVHHLRPHHYARAWGRLWARYEQQYAFTPSVNRAIRHRLRHHPSILLYHMLYQLKRWHA